MRLSYYPGCSLQGTARDYDTSFRNICKAIEIDLVEIPDWNCCGASSAHMLNHEVGVRLPMRNLINNMATGLDIVVPCAACFQRLRAADRALRTNPQHWDLHSYVPDFSIIHISTFLTSDKVAARLREKISRPLQELEIACYYGCLSLRHPRVTGAAHFEQPVTLETLSDIVRAKTVSWSHKTECCSGSLTMARPDIARKLVDDIHLAAWRAGANCFVTDCPMCQANLESRQLDIARENALPVFFATELLETAITGNFSTYQHRKHLVNPKVLSPFPQYMNEEKSL